MTIETDLRAALHERAARVHPTPDLLATDYRPRARRLRAPVAIGGLASTAGALAVVLSLAGGAASAFAGWTAHPSAATAAQLASANAYCATHVPTPGLPLELTDTRGPFTFEIYANATSNDFCIAGPSFLNASGFRTSTPVTVPAGNLYLWAEHTTTDAGHAYGFVIARAGDGVSAATLTLEDGTHVTATVQNGWAVAWWPGSHQVTSAQLTTPSGRQTQTFPLSSCGLHNCAGGPHGGGPAGGSGPVFRGTRPISAARTGTSPVTNARLTLLIGPGWDRADRRERGSARGARLARLACADLLVSISPRILECRSGR